MRSCFCLNRNATLFEIWRLSNQDTLSFYKVYESEVVQRTVNPDYQLVSIKGQQLCNSDKDLPLKFVFINRVDTENVYIGEAVVSVEEMQKVKRY